MAAPLNLAISTGAHTLSSRPKRNVVEKSAIASGVMAGRENAGPSTTLRSAQDDKLGADDNKLTGQA